MTEADPVAQTCIGCVPVGDSERRAISVASGYHSGSQFSSPRVCLLLQTIPESPVKITPALKPEPALQARLLPLLDGNTVPHPTAAEAFAASRCGKEIAARAFGTALAGAVSGTTGAFCCHHRATPISANMAD